MECDILDTLEQLGYNGPLLDEEVLVKACESGLSSLEYINLCVWLTSRLKHICGLEENLSSDPGDSDGLQFEMSALLKELSCPYPTLVSGDLQGRMKNTKDCLKLILYLSTELQAAQIIHAKSLRGGSSVEKSSTSLDLKLICRTLGLSESEYMDAAELFPLIETKINKILEEVPKQHIGKPVLRYPIDSKQWAELEKINAVLSTQYECRRRMLIKRLDVTVQSFSWSDRAKEQIDIMAKAYQPKRHSLVMKPSISLAHLLAAREDICNMVKTSSGSTREKTTCAINKILMGRVPDRGGRPSEIDAPPLRCPVAEEAGRGRERRVGVGEGEEGGVVKVVVEVKGEGAGVVMEVGEVEGVGEKVDGVTREGERWVGSPWRRGSGYYKGKGGHSY